MKTYRVSVDITFSADFEIEAMSEADAKLMAMAQAENDPYYHCRHGYFVGANAYDCEEQ